MLMNNASNVEIISSKVCNNTLLEIFMLLKIKFNGERTIKMDISKMMRHEFGLRFNFSIYLKPVATD